MDATYAQTLLVPIQVGNPALSYNTYSFPPPFSLGFPVEVPVLAFLLLIFALSATRALRRVLLYRKKGWSHFWRDAATAIFCLALCLITSWATIDLLQRLQITRPLIGQLQTNFSAYPTAEHLDVLKKLYAIRDHAFSRCLFRKLPLSLDALPLDFLQVYALRQIWEARGEPRYTNSQLIALLDLPEPNRTPKALHSDCLRLRFHLFAHLVEQHLRQPELDIDTAEALALRAFALAHEGNNNHQSIFNPEDEHNARLNLASCHIRRLAAFWTSGQALTAAEDLPEGFGTASKAKSVEAYHKLFGKAFLMRSLIAQQKHGRAVDIAWAVLTDMNTADVNEEFRDVFGRSIRVEITRSCIQLLLSSARNIDRFNIEELRIARHAFDLVDEPYAGQPYIGWAKVRDLLQAYICLTGIARSSLVDLETLKDYLKKAEHDVDECLFDSFCASVDRFLEANFWNDADMLNAIISLIESVPPSRRSVKEVEHKAHRVRAFRARVDGDIVRFEREHVWLYSQKSKFRWLPDLSNVETFGKATQAERLERLHHAAKIGWFGLPVIVGEMPLDFSRDGRPDALVFVDARRKPVAVTTVSLGSAEDSEQSRQYLAVLDTRTGELSHTLARNGRSNTYDMRSDHHNGEDHQRHDIDGDRLVDVDCIVVGNEIIRQTPLRNTIKVSAAHASLLHNYDPYLGPGEFFVTAGLGNSPERVSAQQSGTRWAQWDLDWDFSNVPVGADLLFSLKESDSPLKPDDIIDGRMVVGGEEYLFRDIKFKRDDGGATVVFELSATPPKVDRERTAIRVSHFGDELTELSSSTPNWFDVSVDRKDVKKAVEERIREMVFGIQEVEEHPLRPTNRWPGFPSLVKNERGTPFPDFVIFFSIGALVVFAVATFIIRSIGFWQEVRSLKGFRKTSIGKALLGVGCLSGLYLLGQIAVLIYGLDAAMTWTGLITTAAGLFALWVTLAVSLMGGVSMVFWGFASIILSSHYKHLAEVFFCLGELVNLLLGAALSPKEQVVVSTLLVAFLAAFARDREGGEGLFGFATSGGERV